MWSEESGIVGGIPLVMCAGLLGKASTRRPHARRTAPHNEFRTFVLIEVYGTSPSAAMGILVATSGYGPTSYQFASGKPLELIDGSNLLYLLAEHAGIEARIVPPEQ
jgi:hypothetical protein